MSYYEKYLKYKNKYQQLKKQMGGNNEYLKTVLDLAMLNKPMDSKVYDNLVKNNLINPNCYTKKDNDYIKTSFTLFKNCEPENIISARNNLQKELNEKAFNDIDLIKELKIILQLIINREKNKETNELEEQTYLKLIKYGLISPTDFIKTDNNKMVLISNSNVNNCCNESRQQLYTAIKNKMNIIKASNINDFQKDIIFQGI